MIIDANANLGHSPFRRVRYSEPGSLVERLGRAGIGRAWVSSMDALLYKDCHTANEPLAAAVAGHEALLPVATINPSFPAWQRDLSECVGRLGFRGVRTYPGYHRYKLGDAPFDELLAGAGELGVFVSVALRMSDERHHNPLCIVPPGDLAGLPEAAARHPGVPILIVNAHNHELTRLAEPLRELPNVYVELSHIEGIGGMAEVGRRVGVERLVFGTHAPYYYPESAILKVTRESEFSPEELQGIMSGNAERLLRRAGGAGRT
jgi:hypothetical protein